MKKLNLSGLLLLCVLAQACTNISKDSDNDDVKVSSKDTAKLMVPIDKDDQQFAIQAENSSLAEVEMAKLAMKKGFDKRVKNSGALMIKDHKKTDDKLRLIAKSKKIILPVTVDSAGQKNIDNLSKNSGTAFDRAYLADMLKEHEANIKLFQTASTQLMDPDLRAYAAKSLLVFKRHLDVVHEIKESIK